MKKLLIINALIWATIIMITSNSYRGSENFSLVIGAMVVGFILQNGFTYVTLKENK